MRTGSPEPGTHSKFQILNSEFQRYQSAYREPSRALASEPLLTS
jgi:hypothetical protein